MAGNKNKLSGPAEHNRRPLTTRMAAGVLALSAFMGGCSSDKAPQPPAPQSAEANVASQSPDVAPVNGEVVRTAEIKSMGERVKKSAIIAATRIVDILELKSSGAAPIWSGDGFSNKGSVLGPDRKFETSDDNRVPETGVGYDPETGRVAFRSTDMTRGKNDKKVFVSAEVTFKLRKRLDVNRALTLKDFREILNHPNDLSVESIYTGNDSPYGTNGTGFFVTHFDKRELNIRTPQSERYKASTSSIDPEAQKALNRALFTLGVASEELRRRAGVR